MKLPPKSFDYLARHRGGYIGELERRRARYAANRERINAERRLSEGEKHTRKVDREIWASATMRDRQLRWYHAHKEPILEERRAERARERVANPKLCVICGAQFLRYKKKITCSPGCSALRKARLTHESHLRTRPRKPKRGPPLTSAEKSRAWRERNPGYGAAYMRQRRAEKSTIIIQQESQQ